MLVVVDEMMLTNVKKFTEIEVIYFEKLICIGRPYLYNLKSVLA